MLKIERTKKKNCMVNKWKYVMDDIDLWVSLAVPLTMYVTLDWLFKCFETHFYSTVIWEW